MYSKTGLFPYIMPHSVSTASLISCWSTSVKTWKCCFGGGVAAWGGKNLGKTLHNMYSTCWYVSGVWDNQTVKSKPKQHQSYKVKHVPVEVLIWGMSEVIYSCFTWQARYLSLFCFDGLVSDQHKRECSHFLCHLERPLQSVLTSDAQRSSFRLWGAQIFIVCNSGKTFF